MLNSSSIYEKRFTVLLKEGALELIRQKIERAITFREFMNSLVGKTRQQIFDAGSFAFLYTGNKYGMTSAFSDEKNPEVLMTKFLQNLGNYLNKGLERPRIYETEEFKKKYDYYGEHKRLEKQRMELGRKAINAPEGPEKDAARSKFYQFQNNGKYLTARREAIEKEDKAVEEYHNKPLTPKDVKNDGSGDYTQLGLMFQKILRMQKGLNEKLDPKKHDAGDYVKDFQKSKAPQFKGKSKKKKQQMAIAAYLDAKEEDAEKESKFKVYKGKDYKVKVEKGKRFTKNGIYMKVYYQNPSLSKSRQKQIANQIHRAISDEEFTREEDENTVGGGALGPAAAVGNRQGDFYAPGDYRVPKMLGAVVQKRTPPELVVTKASGKKKRRKSKKKK